MTTFVVQVIQRTVVCGDLVVNALPVERVEAVSAAEAVRAVADRLERHDVKVSKHEHYEGMFVGAAPWRYSETERGVQIPALQILAAPEPGR